MALILNGSDTSAGDDAGLGYTSAEGLILTGQGSTSDITFKNDADASVFSIPTGTTTALMTTTSELQFYTSAYGIRASTGLEIKTGDFTRFLKGTTEYMRLDTNGKLGIGTTTPASYTSDTLVISSGDQGGMTLVSADNVENYISWADGTSGAAQLQAGYIGYNHSSNYMRFGTVATERMRIESNGNLLVGTTAAYSDGSIGNACFQLDGRSGARTGMCVRAKTTDGSAFVTSGVSMIGFVNGNGTVGNISTDGSATSFNTSSDYRLKENVSYTFDATTRLKQLKPARFNFKSDADKTVDGFLAHEVSSIVPEAISGTKDAVDSNGDAIYQGIDQSKLVPLLVKAMQEQQTVIEALEARITALEGS